VAGPEVGSFPLVDRRRFSSALIAYLNCAILAVMTRNRAWTFVAGIVALVAMVLVAGSLAQVSLGPGHELPAVARESDGTASDGVQATGLIEDAGMEIFLRIVYVLVLVLLPASVIALLVSPEIRKQVLARLVPFLLLLIYVLLVREKEQAPDAAATAVPAEAGPGLDEGGGPSVSFDASPPKTVVWGTRIAVGAGMALVVGAGAWLLWRRSRRPQQGPLGEVAVQAQKAMEALQGGADIRNVILRCYFEMSRILSEERGLFRQSTMTPREFERSLAATGLPEPAVQRLTRLFEGVRYGAELTGDDEEAQAIASLTAIVDACRSAA
jgi:hypothetical protein